MNPFLAIIILNWNSYQVLKDCILSLKKNTFTNYKIIIIDNGSTDGSFIKIKNEFHDLEYIGLKNNMGFAGGNNVGIKCALEKFNPDFFLLLNNDTITDENFLSEMLECATKEINIGLVVPKIYFFDRPNHLYFAGGRLYKFLGLGKHYGWKKPDSIKHSVSREVTFANGCALLVTKQVIAKVGLLDEVYFANIEDVDYSYRVIRNDFKIFYCHKALLWHRVGYASKKNAGEWLRVYLSTRNILIFQMKHFNSIYFIISIVYFFFRWVFYMNLKFIIKGDFKCNKAIFWGLQDGLSKNIRFIN